MQGAGFAEFMERRGRHIVEVAGAYWHSVEGGLYVIAPQCRTLNPDPEELDEMLRRQRGLGVRFLTTGWPGAPNGLYVCRHRDFDMHRVGKRQGGCVRRGLERCEIRPVESSELLTQGIHLNRDTIERQGRADPEFTEEKSWKRLVDAVEKSPGMSALGAFVQGKLINYLIMYREREWLFLVHQMALTSARNFKPSPAMHFQILRQLALDPTLAVVCAGLVPLLDLPSIHDYKLRLGYELEPMTSAYHLHPAVARILTSKPAVGMVTALRKFRPHDQRLERAHSVLEGARMSRRGWISTGPNGAERRIPA